MCLCDCVCICQSELTGSQSLPTIKLWNLAAISWCADLLFEQIEKRTVAIITSNHHSGWPECPWKCHFNCPSPHVHTNTTTHLLIPLSLFVHKPLLHPSHLFPHVPLLHLPLFLPSAMQQLFIDNNDQWEQVLWESSHPGAQGTQHTSSSPACQSLPHILQ